MPEKPKSPKNDHVPAPKELLDSLDSGTFGPVDDAIASFSKLTQREDGNKELTTRDRQPIDAHPLPERPIHTSTDDLPEERWVLDLVKNATEIAKIDALLNEHPEIRENTAAKILITNHIGDLIHKNSKDQNEFEAGGGVEPDHRFEETLQDIAGVTHETALLIDLSAMDIAFENTSVREYKRIIDNLNKEETGSHTPEEESELTPVIEPIISDVDLAHDIMKLYLHEEDDRRKRVGEYQITDPNDITRVLEANADEIYEMYLANGADIKKTYHEVAQKYRIGDIFFDTSYEDVVYAARPTQRLKSAAEDHVGKPLKRALKNLGFNSRKDMIDPRDLFGAESTDTRSRVVENYQKAMAEGRGHTETDHEDTTRSAKHAEGTAVPQVGKPVKDDVSPPWRNKAEDWITKRSPEADAQLEKNWGDLQDIATETGDNSTQRINRLADRTIMPVINAGKTHLRNTRDRNGLHSAGTETSDTLTPPYTEPPQEEPPTPAAGPAAATPIHTPTVPGPPPAPSRHTPEASRSITLPAPVEVFPDDPEMRDSLHEWLKDEFTTLFDEHPALSINNNETIRPLYQFAEHIVNLKLNTNTPPARSRSQIKQWTRIYSNYLRAITNISETKLENIITKARIIGFGAHGYFEDQLEHRDKRAARLNKIRTPKILEKNDAKPYLNSIDEMKVGAVRWYYSELTGNIDSGKLTAEEFDRLVKKWSQWKNITYEVITHGLPIAGALAAGYATGGVGYGIWHAASAISGGVVTGLYTDRWNRKAEGGSKLSKMQLLGGLAKFNEGLHDGAYHKPAKYKGIKEAARVFWGEQPSKGVRFDRIAVSDMPYLLNRGRQSAKQIQKRTRLALATSAVITSGVMHQDQIRSGISSFWDFWASATPPAAEIVAPATDTGISISERLDALYTPTHTEAAVQPSKVYNCTSLCDSTRVYGVQTSVDGTRVMTPGPDASGWKQAWWAKGK